ncbi:ABC transporter permease [Paenibacillus sp. N3/727]|uniref:ABC transporter permease n=1 Tax=Paenibacillus sp. N3/727 TaxID=2925845 RepID=UPI001F536139|nr:ABC transporter permease [Paenibacillus sp. N3/727]UNK18248.1 ABC transporter permease [Paenibacillus sp. N3/727]
MFTILTTMLRGIFRDIHTMVWNVAFPLAMLVGLGLYFDNPAYSDRLLSGVLTTNVLFGATMVTAFYVMSHRNRGVYKLLRATPFSTLSFITAMTGARTVLALFVSVCVIIVSVLLLGVSLSLTGLALMLLVLLIGTVCFTAIGFIAANLSRDESNVNMISNLMSFPLLFTSEAFYSLEQAPQWVRVVGKLQPFHYLVEAMGIAIKTDGGSLSAIGLPLGILTGFTVVCLVLAALTFRWDSERPASRVGKHREQHFSSV